MGFSKGMQYRRIATTSADFDAERFVQHMKAHCIGTTFHGSGIYVSPGDWPMAITLRGTANWSRPEFKEVK